MKNLIILLFLISLISCSPMPRRNSSSISKSNRTYKSFMSKKLKHLNCVKSLVHIDVVPTHANSICIDIYRKTF